MGKSLKYLRAEKEPMHSKTFWSSFIMGFGALALLGSHQFDPPRYIQDGIGADWRNIGDDLRSAMHKETQSVNRE